MSLRRIRKVPALLAGYWRLCKAGRGWIIPYQILNAFRGLDLRAKSVEDLGLSPQSSHFYSDSGGYALERVFKELVITAGDAIVDVGCGKGGALLTFAKFKFQAILGIDLSAEVLASARHNLKRMGLGRVRLECVDATAFTGYDDYNYVYLYNPFPCPVVVLAMQNLRGSIEKKPRRVRLVYRNAVCHDQVLAVFESAHFRRFNYDETSWVVYEISGSIDPLHRPPAATCLDNRASAR